MTNLTEDQKQELVDHLIQCSFEDTAFLNNRLFELVDLNGPELWETWYEAEE